MAIKKIKMGQFKDGLDMSAIREIKTLQELRHPNVVGVSTLSFLLGRVPKKAARLNQHTDNNWMFNYTYDCHS